MPKEYKTSFGKGLEYIYEYVDEETNEVFINLDYHFPHDFVSLSVPQLLKELLNRPE
jgi:hypothetical protein